MLRGEKNKIAPISEGYIVLNNRVGYAAFYSVTVKAGIVGFSQWGGQQRAQGGRKRRQIYLRQ